MLKGAKLLHIILKNLDGAGKKMAERQGNQATAKAVAQVPRAIRGLARKTPGKFIFLEFFEARTHEIMLFIIS